MSQLKLINRVIDLIMPRQLIRVYARRYTYQLLNVSNDDNLKRYVTA